MTQIKTMADYLTVLKLYSMCADSVIEQNV